MIHVKILEIRELDNMVSFKQIIYLNKKKDVIDIETIPLVESVSFDDWKPMLIRRNNDTWQVISRQGKWIYSIDENIPCLEIECTEQEAFHIFIEDNKIHGFSMIEKAKIIERLSTKYHLTLQEISKKYASILDIPSGTRILSDYMKLLSFPNDVIDALHKNIMPFKNALILLDFNADEMQSIIQLFHTIRWNPNKQKEVLTLLWEITRKQNITVTQYLQTPAIQDILEQSDRDEVFRQRLQKEKNPNLADVQQKIDEVLKGQRSDLVQLIPTPALEKKDWQVSFTVRTENDLISAIDTLQKWEKNELLSNLLKITSFS